MERIGHPQILVTRCGLSHNGLFFLHHASFAINPFLTLDRRTVMPSEAKKTEVLDQFLDRFIASGFGALSKKETDRLVFSLLAETGRVRNLDAHFEISRMLKVSIPKARNLVYEYRLHQSVPLARDRLCDELRNVLASSRFAKSQDRIVLEVKDALLREEFEEFIHANTLGSAPDYSFNRSLLLLDFNTFSALVEKLAGEEQMRKIERELRKLKTLPQGLPNGRALLGKFLEGAASRAGATTIDLAGLLATGGVSTVVANLHALLPSDS